MAAMTRRRSPIAAMAAPTAGEPAAQASEPPHHQVLRPRAAAQVQLAGVDEAGLAVGVDGDDVAAVHVQRQQAAAGMARLDVLAAGAHRARAQAAALPVDVEEEGAQAAAGLAARTPRGDRRREVEAVEADRRVADEDRHRLAVLVGDTPVGFYRLDFAP